MCIFISFFFHFIHPFFWFEYSQFFRKCYSFIVTYFIFLGKRYQLSIIARLDIQKHFNLLALCVNIFNFH